MSKNFFRCFSYSTMINPINNSINKIRKIKKTDKNMLNLLYRNSQRLIRKYENIFTSGLLKELYTDEFAYKGTKSYMTTVKCKKNGLALPVKIQCLDDGEEEYVFLKSGFGIELGSKFFTKKYQDGKMRFGIGYIESKKNTKYEGIGIRLTQVQVEEAIRCGVDKIPCSSYPASLPFHTMMGFRPKKSGMPVYYLKALYEYMRVCKEEYCNTASKYFKPILYKKDGNFCFWPSYTVANAVLNDLKNNPPIKKMEALEFYEGDMIPLELSGKYFDDWKKRILLQPITFSNVTDIINKVR